MIDLLVAGGGPVGLATALLARQAGMRVAVAEPRVDAPDKACGEGLMPSAVAALADVGVNPEGLPFRGIRYVGSGAHAEARFRGQASGLGVRRTTLQAALSARADDLGVIRVPARVTDVVQDGAGIEARVGPGSHRARWLAVADGLHSPLRRRLGLDAPARRASPARYGLRRHYALPPWTDLVEVHWAADAEAYVTPVAPGVVGVAVLCGGGAPYDAWLRSFPFLQERLAGAEPLTRVRGAGPLRQASRRRVQGRALLVGDAAGYVDALTGEGLAVGLAQARALVRCLAAGRPQGYEEAWRRASRRSQLLTRGLLWVTGQPPLRSRLVPAAARAPWAFATAVEALRRA